MKKRLIVFLVILLLLPNLSSCIGKQPVIAYTVYPIRYLFERIAGDKVTLVEVSDNTGLMRMQASEDFLEQVKEADLFVSMGILEPYLTVYASELDKISTSQIKLTSKNSPYGFKRYTKTLIDGKAVYTEDSYYNNPLFDKVDYYNYDPYLWMDPVAMESMATEILDWLLDHYPQEASYFRENYEALIQDLAVLDAQYHQLIPDNSDKRIAFVSMTPCYGNWQKNYGIEVYPVFLSRYGAQPSAAQLEAIKQRIIADGVKYIVKDSNMPDYMTSLYNSLKEDLDLEEIELHNLVYLSEAQEEKHEDYLSLMHANLSSLLEIDYTETTETTEDGEPLVDE
ncbi:MAG: metal ABC transporter substrate-binding protein [Erysipelotrichaceae bacterium]|jgi:ABC-type Zn uptake system ZnuABC Zn-binding protein ZnuA|nr:metal ABC transporter substrate-binding protein [Erysipelotrichaceae bacterium]